VPGREITQDGHHPIRHIRVQCVVAAEGQDAMFLGHFLALEPGLPHPDAQGFGLIGA